MFVQPIDYALVVWFALAAASTAYVAYDQFAGNPEATVMKWGFVLITAYMGPFGLLMYVMADKEPEPGAHAAFIEPLWKQGAGSTIHCCAGDATDIIVAAAVTSLLGLPMWLDLIVEYVAGFAFGLFVFQALFMRGMMGGSYVENVRRTFVPEFISMNAMMGGMALVMGYLMMGRDMRAMDATEMLFWGVMSLGVIAGFTLAFPFNVWMVAKGLKHGLMTQRPHSSESSHRSSHDGGSDSHARHRADPAVRSPRKGPFAATTPQIATIAGVATLLLTAGVGFPALSVNLTVGARDVRNAIMPHGMIMTREVSAEAMREMAAVHPRFVARSLGPDDRGGQPLEAKLEGDVKTFELTARPIQWHILPDVAVDAYAFNDQVPGPRLRVRQGDRVRIVVHNALPESTTVHWHGLVLHNAMDGPAEITQPPIPTGGSYVYEFVAGQAGTFFYHSHDHPDRQQALGLYGALLVDPADPSSEPRADHEYVLELQEWLKRDGLTYPAMLMEGALPNYFTINGKSYPSTDVVRMRIGETVKLRFIGTHNNFIHPMHVHGGPFVVVARDGVALGRESQFVADTINVGPGQRYDVIWTARGTGKWLVHCHIPHHTTNNNQEPQGGGGLMLLLEVSG